MVCKRPTREADASLLWEGLIPEQKKEIEASHGKDGLSTIALSIGASVECLSFFSSSTLLAIAGIVPLSILGGRASPWLLSTEALLSQPRLLLRHTKPVLQEWLEDWDVLENYIDARYDKAIRWAKWSGFIIYPAIPYGVAGQLFHKIEMRK